MATAVLRIRLVGGDYIDVTYEGPEHVDQDRVVDHVVATLAQDGGVLRTRHNDRLVVVHGRGVAAIEVASRGADS